MKTRQIACAAIAALPFAGSLAGECAAQVSNSAAYNSPYGMSQATTNQTIDPSLRDANGNLTVVNGQFTSATMSQQSGVQSTTSLGSSGSGVGFGGPVSTDTVSAIGNSLNVVTVGSNNTVIVNSEQTNNGNQTATINSH